MPNTIVFDKSNPNWLSIRYQNRNFLENSRNFANEILRFEDRLSLNRVYDILGFEQTDEGDLVGWIKGTTVEFGDLIEKNHRIELVFNTTDIVSEDESKEQE